MRFLCKWGELFVVAIRWRCCTREGRGGCLLRLSEGDNHGCISKVDRAWQRSVLPYWLLVVERQMRRIRFPEQFV